MQVLASRARALDVARVCALSVAAGVLVVLYPAGLIGAVALLGVALVAGRAKSLPLMALGALTLLPLHALLLEVGAPPWWKEALTASLIVLALPRAHLVFRGPLPGAIAVFVAVVVASALLNRRMGAYDLGPYVTYIPLALIIPVVIRKESHIRVLCLAFMGAAAVDAVIVILAQLRNMDIVQLGVYQSPFLSRVRPSSYAGPNLITATVLGIAAGSAIAWFVMRRGRGSLATRAGRVGVAAFFTLGALMTLARGAALAVAAGVIVAPLLILARRRLSEGPVGVAVPVVAAVIAVAAIPLAVSADSLLGQRFSVFTGINDPADIGRLDRWRTTIEIAVDHPVLGAGPGYTGLSRVRDVLGTDPEYLPDDLTIPISESSWLKIAAETGLAGVLAAAAATWLAARALWRSSARYDSALLALAVLVVIVIHATIYQSMETYIGGAMFWSIVGIAGAYQRLSADPRVPAIT